MDADRRCHGVDRATDATADQSRRRDPLELADEELWRQRYREAGGDDRANRERIAGEIRDARLEADADAGAVDETVARRGRPGVAGEIGNADARTPGQAVLRPDRRDHRLVEQVVSSRVVVLPARLGRILEAQCDVKGSFTDACDEFLGGPLFVANLELRLRLLQTRDRRGHERRECARESADAQEAPAGGEGLAELRLSQLQPFGEGFGVAE